MSCSVLKQDLLQSSIRIVAEDSVMQHSIPGLHIDTTASQKRRRRTAYPGGAAALGLQGPAGSGHVCLCVRAARDQGQAPLPLHVHVINHISYHTPAKGSAQPVEGKQAV